ncbi:DUF4160 domain-containing protein [Chloroflexi bacterium TSY]|nr:DUF4160 domain-containing protein [Chloroflexi bacterium TSY]
MSSFHGIVINIYYESGTHQLPHFHARHGKYKASFTFSPPALLAGTLPRRQQNLILAWAELHQDELAENWELASQEAPLNKIEGLR